MFSIFKQVASSVTLSVSALGQSTLDPSFVHYSRIGVDQLVQGKSLPSN